MLCCTDAAALQVLTCTEEMMKLRIDFLLEQVGGWQGAGGGGEGGGAGRITEGCV